MGKYFNVARMTEKELQIAVKMFEEDLQELEQEAEYLNGLLNDAYSELDRRKSEHTQ